MIYNFVSSLKNSSIYKTNFKNKIDFFFNEFESFLSGFSCFQIKNENHNYNYNLIKKCELPFNETREIIDRQDNYDSNLISNPEISGYYTQTKPDSENFENENENKNEKTNEHFIDIGKTTQIYDNRFTKKITNKKDLNKRETIKIRTLIPKLNNETNNSEKKIEEKKEIDPTFFTLGNKEYNFDIIRKLFEETKNTPTAMLEYILNIVEKDKIKKKEEKFGIIRNNNEIEDLITEIDTKLKKNESNKDYFNSSLLFQN